MKLNALLATPLAFVLQTVNNTSQELIVGLERYHVISPHPFLAPSSWKETHKRTSLRLKQEPEEDVLGPEVAGKPSLEHHYPTHGWGMGPVLYTFVLGILSGISLPVGAYLGVTVSPVGETAVGAIMAFGAGALLFAVTVELYGHSLNELSRGNVGYYEMYTTISFALLGALFYLHINRWLEKSLSGKDDNDDHSHKHHERGEEHHDEEQQQDDGHTADPRSPAKAATLALGQPGIVKPGRSPRLTDRVSNSAMASKRAKERWDKIRKLVRNWTIVRHWGLVTKLRGHQRTGFQDALLIAATGPHLRHSQTTGSDREKEKAKKVALALFLGLLVDGVPEGVLMGFLAAEGHLTPVLVISLFIANFPEAFSSASLLKIAGMRTWVVLGIWGGLCVLIASLGAMSCAVLLHFYPEYGPGVDLPIGVLLGIAAVEGVTGGAMICCVSAVMLPEAFERAGKTERLYISSGFLCTAGFLVAVAFKAIGG